MKITVRVTSYFQKQAKPLLKKYPSLREELKEFENKLLENPRLGISLGKSVYKIRLKVKSKGRGKRGGLRIISLVDEVIIGYVESDDKEITVYLLSIYDKSTTDTLNDRDLKTLISQVV
ncbi:MAG: hypothetical protein EPN82_07725 [Bacteroidetes bacterium]|nr:MAG: hypothetical protein EPN82_07725 [Bacteroidota bacterium]